MQKRITIFDTVRGFTMISMAGFHACYDLAYLYGWDMPWFTQTVFQDIWRASISWVFLFIAGWMCTLSHNNAKRAAKYAAAALVVWIATTLEDKTWILHGTGWAIFHIAFGWQLLVM